MHMPDIETDGFLSPCGPLGSKTSLSIEGQFIGQFSLDTDALKAFDDWCEKNQCWPSLWYIDDHGGIEPVFIHEGK